MSRATDIWAVVPVKETADAKQRLEGALPAELRTRLALAMLEDVLASLAAAPELAGIAVVTVDASATRIAHRFGARILTEGARDGQTGAVTAAARSLGRDGHAAMLTVPGDIPLITPREVAAIVAAHERRPDFVIVPAHDERGSNAILCAPPDGVPLKFGDDSFLPHLAAARSAGIEPRILRLPGIAFDVDHPRDLAAFLKLSSGTRSRALLDEAGVVAEGIQSEG
jgi:2-phospho-L-lactate guanylyltransferase